MRIRIGYMLAALIGIPAATGNAQRPTITVTGLVTDTSGFPIPFANVMLTDGRRIVASEAGRFALNIDASTRTIEIRRIGFEARVISMETWPDTALRIALVPLPLRLERVRVEAAQRIQSLAIRGFYERQAELEKGINHGFFITPEELEKRPAARPTDFLYNHPGVKVQLKREPGDGGRTGLQPQGLNGCRIEIYVDGVRFYPMPPSHGLRYGRINFINDFIPISNIAAMEVYPRAVSAPPKYQAANGDCGVMLIWTK